MSSCVIVSDKLINSATGISYFTLNVGGIDKTVTVIGEYHMRDFVCDGKDSIRVYDYCLDRFTSNPKCNILLEYNPSETNLDRIGSTIINDIFSGTDKTMKTKRTKGIDNRQDILSRDQQNMLYNDDIKFSSTYENKSDKLMLDFVYSYLNSPIKKSSSEYSERLNIYKDHVDDCFKKLSKDNINVLDLRWAWCKSMDHHVLTTITKSNEVNEYIIVVGENHRSNITEVVKQWGVEVSEQKGKTSSDCVNLKGLEMRC